MKPKALLLAWCLWAASGLQAGALDEAFAGLGKHRGVTADFTMTRELKILKRPFVSQGRFTFTKDQGLLWETLHPFAQSLRISSQGELLNGTEGGKQEQLAQVAKIFYQLSSGILQGNRQELERWFEIQETAAHQLRLVPRSNAVGQAMRQIELEVAPGGKVQTLVILGQDFKMTLAFSKLVYLE